MNLQTRRLIFILFFILGAWLPSARAEEGVSRTGYLPDAHEIFHPIQADLREPQTALRLALQVSHKLNGEVDLGDYKGLYRWHLPWEGGYFQVNAGGGIFARFDLVSDRKDLQVVDFSGNMAFDTRVNKKWSVRVVPYHVSSHLGDDYLVDKSTTSEKHSYDNVREIVSFTPNDQWRFYGGHTYIFRTLHTELGREAVQGGIEWTSPWWIHRHAQLIWANDIQSWERTHWNPTFNSQLGLKTVYDPAEGRSITWFFEFFAGHNPAGQFLQNQETRWTFGFKFNFL